MNRLFLASISALTLSAQIAGLGLPPSGNNQRATVSQTIGPVRVSIDYSSPAVHGPAGPGNPEIVDRRGKIWGKLVPYGLNDPGFGNGQPVPWRAGANENTVFTVSHDVEINGKPLAAGAYGVHMIVEPEEWTVIFSKSAGAWGSFFYEAKDDVLRVAVKPHKHEYREYLTYEFPVRKPAEAVAEMQWEDLAVGWTITVPRVKEYYFSKVREQLHNATGFGWQAWVAASQWCVAENYQLEEALVWADYAIKAPFVGQENFQTLSNKAQVLTKLGKTGEAERVMQTAIGHPTATPPLIHMYGRQLLSAGKPAEAMAVFEMNAKRFGDEWPTHVGLARGYAANGQKEKALDHARKALAQAPDPINKAGMEAFIQSLSR